MKCIAVLAFCLLVSACGGGGGTVEPPVACTMDVKACADGSFVGRIPPSCAFAPCPDEIVFETACASDGDCSVVNSRYGYGCCWAGSCDPLDYSKDEWIAVNAAWFSSGRAGICPPRDSCGPQPLCPVVIINDRYGARCIAGACRKLPLN